MRLFAICVCLLILFNLAAVTAAQALACSDPLSNENFFRGIDLIAEGEVSGEKDLNGRRVTQFKILKLRKGTVGDTILVRDLPGNRTHVALTALPDGTYRYDPCDGGTYAPGTINKLDVVILDKYQKLWSERLAEVESNPSGVEVLLRLARFLELYGDRPGARSAYERAISLAPEEARGHAGLGRILTSFKLHSEALDPLKRALELSPYDGRTLQALTHARLMLGHKIDYNLVDFRSLDVEDLDLSGQDLRGRDFRGAVLRKANFRDALLDGAVFASAVLTRADFSGASMRGAILRNAGLYGAKFSRTDLTETDATRAHLESARFSHVRLDGFTAYGANLNRVHFENTVLRWVDLTESSLVGARFAVVDFGWVNFSGVDLGRVHLSGLDLSKTFLTDVKLHGAKFDCATQFPEGFDKGQHALVPAERVCEHVVQNLSFRDGDWTQYDFSGLDLTGADFRRANLSRAKFYRSILRFANFDGARVEYTHFDAADLEGANFSRTQGPAEFFGANLKNANFSNTDWIGDLAFRVRNSRGPDAPLTDTPADLTGAVLRNSIVSISGLLVPGNKWPDYSGADLSGSTLKCGKIYWPSYLSKNGKRLMPQWRVYQERLRYVARLAKEQPRSQLHGDCADAIAKYSADTCSPWIAKEKRPPECVFPE